jgi:hypothetical protein
MIIITRTQALALIEAEAEDLPFPRVNAQGENQIRAWLKFESANPEAEEADFTAWLDKAEQAASNAAPGDGVVPIELRPWDAREGRAVSLLLPWEAFDWVR